MIESSAVNRAAIALNRFGLGARPDDAIPGDPKRWLSAQLEHYDALPAAWAGQPDTARLTGDFSDFRRQIRDASSPQDKKTIQQSLREDVQEAYRSAVDARVLNALVTPTPFIERLVHFWSNHFAVSVEKAPVRVLAGNFEAQAIRPHVLGRFEDMSVAVARHPAMLIFLDQNTSVGPDSRAARRAAIRNPERVRGLNENLARETLELHTLGVRSGYTQADVTEFARALTGWSVGGLGGNPRQRENPGEFVFREPLHEPGTRTILGRRYDQDGEAQALAALHDFDASPATAQHIATKLSCHFVADQPPPSLVARLRGVFIRSRGDLPSVYRALIDSPEAWSHPSSKFKTPWEWTISSLRGLGQLEIGRFKFAPLLRQLGQPVWGPGSPAGYDDVAASWAAPDALVRRVELAQRLAARVGDSIDARALGPRLLAGSLSASTAAAVSRAESAQTALALLLVSPDFQRR
jgi:uncharacterized protein (DUF1800 family)